MHHYLQCAAGLYAGPAWVSAQCLCRTKGEGRKGLAWVCLCACAREWPFVGLVCGLPLPMWNMFIVLCVRQTPRPPWPPFPSTSPRNLSCYSNSAWAIFLSQHLCKRYPSWRSARAKNLCQGGWLRKTKQTKKKKNRTKAPGDKTHVPHVREKEIIVLCSFLNPSLTQSYMFRWAGLVCIIIQVQCVLLEGQWSHPPFLHMVSSFTLGHR